MESYIKSLKLNLESVTDTAISQAEIIEKLQSELAELNATNVKLKEQLRYATNMKKAYRNEWETIKAQLES